jgi:hypothetical protein
MGWWRALLHSACASTPPATTHQAWSKPLSLFQRTLLRSSGLLPSKATLDALASSLAAAPPPTRSPTAASTAAPGPSASASALPATPQPMTAPVPAPDGTAQAPAGRSSIAESPALLPASVGAHAEPAAVYVLRTCAALGYTLPPRAAAALVLAAPPAAPSELAALGAPSQPSGAADDDPCAGWLRVGVLADWLAALAFHGLLPAPIAHGAGGMLSPPPAAAAHAAGDRAGEASASCGHSGSGAGAVQPCPAWLEAGVLRALAGASAWELPALAARLAAAARAHGSWTR